MPLDKELYRQAAEWYRQWNEAEMLERAREAGHRPPGEGWRQYLDLWESCWNMRLTQSQRQREQRLFEWDEYYSRVRRLEAWRQPRGRTS